ncbi:MAG: L,D-transpeptidase [Rhizobiales bacterium]|nr:L,D-transpeptidase [Hyphomicrobiales bacterium]
MRIAPRPGAGALAVVLIAFLGLPARAAVIISIDKSAQLMTVEVDGQPRYRWPVSTGRSKFATPSGSFKAFRMEEDHFSREWDDAPMPHSIFFTPKGHAIHGYLDTRRIGWPASHGCVRLEPQNAKTLFTLVKAEGVLNTRVVITGDERIAALRPAPPAQRQQPQPGGLQQADRAQALPPPQDIRPRYGQQEYADQGYQQPRYGQTYAERDYYGQPRYVDQYGRPYYQRRYYDPRYDPPDYSPYDRRPRGLLAPLFPQN